MLELDYERSEEEEERKLVDGRWPTNYVIGPYVYHFKYHAPRVASINCLLIVKASKVVQLLCNFKYMIFS